MSCNWHRINPTQVKGAANRSVPVAIEANTHPNDQASEATTAHMPKHTSGAALASPALGPPEPLVATLFKVGATGQGLINAQSSNARTRQAVQESAAWPTPSSAK